MNAAGEALRILPNVVAYEWHKASAFRFGLLAREVLRGIPRALVMLMVYLAMFASRGTDAIRGYTLEDLIGYLVWTSVIVKVLSDERTLDVAEQIFDGYITKYLVMPTSFFVLVLGRGLCFTLTQCLSAALFWMLGAALLPAYWPWPASWTALSQAALLVALGAYCFFLVHLVLNYLAFWVDVVWSLLAMFRFVAMFISGMLLPISFMPDGVHLVLRQLFPYWVAFGPAELLLGRMGTEGFIHGLWVLGASALALQWLTAFTWRRGTERYAGAGA